jgi:hypothetical protein
MRIKVILVAAGLFALATCGTHAVSKAAAGKLKTDDFLAACAADQNVTDMPGLEAGSKVTPQIYCECVSGKLQGSKLSQSDVDMLTKVHKDAVTDEDAQNYPKLEDLLTANESFEDACKTSLGIPVEEDDEGTDEEAPTDDDNSPPE